MLVLFFVMLLDDWVINYKSYYITLSVYFALQFFHNLSAPLIITTRTTNRIHTGKHRFNTIWSGSGRKALKLLQEMKSLPQSTGFKLSGFVNIDEKESLLLSKHMSHLGTVQELKQINSDHKIEECYSPESREHSAIKNILPCCRNHCWNQCLPDMYDILLGKCE
jgi:FlaA1/EpsC-like NDP-sugar epimerase